MLKPALPDPPESLTAAAKAEWTRLAKELFTAGLLTNADRNALANYCEAWADWVDARKHINKDGGKIIVTDKGYEMQSPWVGMANKAAANMLRIAAEFGFTPASRARISVAPPKTPEEEAEERVFGSLA
jgi:P27 family predicted phage terminase small subunit